MTGGHHQFARQLGTLAAMSGVASGGAPSFALGLTGKCAEVLERLECTVTGAVPAWLSGCTLLRNGTLGALGAVPLMACTAGSKVVGRAGSEILLWSGRWYGLPDFGPQRCFPAGPGTFDIELAGGRGTLTVPHW